MIFCSSRDCDVFNRTTSRIVNVENVTFDDETGFRFPFKAPTNVRSSSLDSTTDSLAHTRIL